jgi:hypothetical protein
MMSEQEGELKDIIIKLNFLLTLNRLGLFLNRIDKNTTDDSAWHMKQ